MGRASEVSVRTLVGCKVVLERGSDTFVEVGRALLEIRDRHSLGRGPPSAGGSWQSKLAINRVLPGRRW